MANHRYTVYADAQNHAQPIEIYDILKGNEGKYTAIASETKDQVRNVIDLFKRWVPAAAEVYEISADAKDYIFVPVTIMPSDLPNRNGVGFPYTELSKFNPEAGKMAYRTWKGKPTFSEHNNKNIREAKGVIVDAALRPLTGYEGNIWKAALLNSFDRGKDAILANEILTKNSRGYSMGAYCEDYSCSICDARVSAGGCDHVRMNKPDFSKRYNGHLAYLQALDITGFECSSVQSPAYITGISDSVYDINWDDIASR